MSASSENESRDWMTSKESTTTSSDGTSSDGTSSDGSQVKGDPAEIKSLVDLMPATQGSDAIRDWLDAPDATVNYNDALSKRHASSCLWLVESTAYLNWLERDNSFLWINGAPGCGKSVLCSTAVQYAFEHTKSDDPVGIAFFYFSFNDSSKQDASAMLRALVLQLSSQVETRSDLTHLYGVNRYRTPPVYALMNCLHQLVQKFQHVYLYVDAIDETPSYLTREEVLENLAKMRGWTIDGLHIFTASGDEPDIRKNLDLLPEEEISMKNEGVDNDIAKFVSSQLRSRPGLRKWSKHASEIEQMLTSKANGVFRWVECQLRWLESCLTAEAETLNSLPQTLDETYERMLFQIDSDLQTDYVRRILTLLCFSQRPLKVQEVIHATTVELGDDPRVNNDLRLCSEKDILVRCLGLVEVSLNDASFDHSENRVMHISHYSIHEYLKSDRIRSQKAAIFSLQATVAHEQLAQICLTYLLNPDLLETKGQVESKSEFLFADYAARYWHHHYRMGTHSNKTTEILLAKLFLPEGEALRVWINLWDPDIPDEISHKHGSIPENEPNRLYYASLLGLLSTVRLLLESGADVNAEGGTNGSALKAASKQGSKEVVQLLLEQGANVNADENFFDTALLAAIESGSKEVVQLLLTEGVDFNADEKGYRSALGTALIQGNKEVVQLLLDKGADVNREGAYGPPLQVAAAHSSKEIVQLLLDQKADVNQEAGGWGSALQAATHWGRKDIVQLLLDSGADVNGEGGWYGSALQAALSTGNQEVLRLLLDKGADPNVTNDDGWTPLNSASHEGDIEVVALLLEKGADVNAVTNDGWTPLYSASLRSHIEAAKLLLGKEADVNATTNHGWTPLNTASHEGNIEVTKLLLESGADVNRATDYGWTPLHSASNRSNCEVAKLLLGKRADINATTDRGWTPLNSASYESDVKVVKLLIENGADVHAATDCGRTPLYSAWHGRNVEVVKLLLENGADVTEVTTSLLSSAWHEGCIEMVVVLLNKRSDLTLASTDGMTPLHRASGRGYSTASDYVPKLEYVTGKDSQKPQEWPTEDWVDYPKVPDEYYDSEGRLDFAPANESTLLKIEEQRSSATNISELDYIHTEDCDIDLETIVTRATLNVESREWLEEYCIRKDVLGNRSPLALAALNMFGVSLHSSKQYRLAADTHLLVLELSHSFRYRPPAFKAISVRMDLADSLHELGYLKEELKQLKVVLEYLRNAVIGTSRPETFDAFERIVAVLESLGRIDEAYDFQRELMHLRKRTYPLSEIDGEDWKVMTRLQFKKREYSVAWLQHVIMFEKKLARFGNPHLETLEAMRAVAMCELELRDRNALKRDFCAFIIIRYVVKQLQILLGPEHSETRAAELDMKTISERWKPEPEKLYIFEPPSLDWAITDMPNDVLLLLEAGVDPNIPFATDVSRCPPLVKVLRNNGETRLVKLLLDKGAVWNASDVYDRTAMGDVIWNPAENNLENLRALLEKANPDEVFPNSAGITSLHFAAMLGKKEHLQILLEHGASAVAANYNGSKAVHYAAREGHTECVKALVVHIKNKAKERGLEYLRCCLESLTGQSLLSVACDSGHVELVKYLMTDDVHDINAGDRFGRPPLYFAVASGHEHVVEALLTKPHIDIRFHISDGRNLLHVAAAAGSVKTLDKLMELGLDIRDRDAKGDSVLSYAAAGGSLTCIERVVSRLTIPERNWSGLWSPLHWICRSGKFEAVRSLIQAGVKNRTAATSDLGEWTPLDIAKHYNNEDVISGSLHGAEQLPELLAGQQISKAKHLAKETTKADSKGHLFCDLCLHV